MYNAIGLDIGGTNIKYALIDEDGHVLFESIRATGSGMGIPHVLDNIKIAVTESISYANANGLQVAGIGIGAPGIIDNGLVTACMGNLPELEGMALGGLLKEHYSLPVEVQNDGNVMALAELRFGAARGFTDVIFLTIGTGIGGAMVLNGKLYGGYHNKGGELGHIHIKSGGKPCTCGATGCLEALASIPALIEEYKLLVLEAHQLSEEKEPISAFIRESGSPFPENQNPVSDLIDGKFIVSAYLQNQSAAVLAMDRHFDYLGSGIASLINVFGPEKVIVGGGISEAGDFYIRQIRSRALAISMKETSAHTSIEPAQLGNKAGFLGAAALVFDSLQENK